MIIRFETDYSVFTARSDQYSQPGFPQRSYRKVTNCTMSTQQRLWTASFYHSMRKLILVRCRGYISLIFHVMYMFSFEWWCCDFKYYIRSKSNFMVKGKQFNVLFSTSKFGFNRTIVVESQKLKCKGNEQWRIPFQEICVSMPILCNERCNTK